MKVFVTGVTGQLGYDGMVELVKRGYQVIGSGSRPCEDIEIFNQPGLGTIRVPYIQQDITDQKAVRETIERVYPDVIIHCAAWTAVDAAEDEENKATTSKEECMWAIRTSLAGRVGEIVVFGDEDALNTGASADLRHASSIALNMLTTFGMQEGHLFSISRDELLQSNLMPVYVEKAEEILKQEEKTCFDLVEKGKDKIVEMAKALLEKNHLNQEEIAELLAGDI